MHLPSCFQPKACAETQQTILHSRDHYTAVLNHDTLQCASIFKKTNKKTYNKKSSTHIIAEYIQTQTHAHTHTHTPQYTTPTCTHTQMMMVMKEQKRDMDRL